MKNCRAILIAEGEATLEFQQKLVEAGICNIATAIPSAVSSGRSLSTKLDLYLYLAGDPAEPPDFACIQRLRRSNDPNVAYAPMMLVAERLTHGTLGAAINAGFDDILLRPAGANEIYARIVAAITSPHVFYACETYAGPDRRRGLLPRAPGPERRRRSGRASRLIIERSIAGGCRIRRAERIDPAPSEDLGAGELSPS